MAAVVVAATVAAGCGGGGGRSSPSGSGLTPAVQQRQITVDGVVRSYRVFAPPTVGTRPRTPLVVVLHGGADSVRSTVDTTMFDRQAEAGNFVAVYPQGTRLEWNAGFCCGSAPERKVDDVGFLDQMLDRVEADYPIDTTRVFLTGVSNGAMLAYVYACQHADRVTAVGSVAGSMVLDSCHPSRPVSVLEVHGTQDPLVPYQGGRVDQSIAPGSTFEYPSSAALAQRWADLDTCPAPSTPSANGPVSTETWTACARGSQVSLVTVNGGGHVWFAPGLGVADGALDATGLIWQFFSSLHPSS